ncbi:aldehyde dehydrogenase [Sodiomyces alkalinus F11]|uniref:Aldehyde dehydrogenase n=1 Tax=Sodiomyces alkalinus (strain CBS 110278 / VKM F-3762 / F11) TaxID=1314773 RepID=A0A3N2PMV7_SODAK|nr:aldehyde dehydrogenase [Sodiomyces alkalinus F11]ROT35861.1 aldehyde dehydrogenase [Sodiomyces alkalinus F11]
MAEKTTSEAANGTTTYSVPFFLNGKEVHPSETFSVISPATGKVVHNCGSATVEDAKAAVDSAAKAFRSWRKTTPGYRRDIFFKAAEVMQRRRAELAQYMTEETGGLPQWCEFNLDVAIDMIKDVAGRIATVEGSFPATKDPDFGSIVLREPYGVVLAIAPWNAPYILGTRAIVFPMAAGNTVVLKGTELSPRVMWAIASVFHEAGLPAGVLNTITHKPAAAPQITSALIADPLIKKINFTGSTVVGRIIAKLAGENLKPVVLELGGKAPAIVWEDADLDLAADQSALGSFFNAGQVCMCTERILVHKAVKRAFLAKLAASIDKFFPPRARGGDAPVLINELAVAKNKRLVADATAKGASVVYGDVDAQEASATRLRPVVLDNVTRDMDIYATESFGPSVSVYEISDEQEAVDMANDTEYGLTSAVFTEDLRRGLRFAREIESGAVHINSMSIHDESNLPHGGVKGSGYGRFNAASGLAEWVRTKVVTFKA